MASILSSVVTNLSTIIIQEVEFLGNLRVELQSIKDEFQQMTDFLEGADVLVKDHPDVRCWVGQVRDVAYDVEDVLDEFVMRCTYRLSTRWYGAIHKMYTMSVRAIKARHELATRVKEIKKRIRDISETHGRYKTQYESLLPEKASLSRFSRVNDMVHDKRGDALFLEEADLVGIEVPKKELSNRILSGDARRNVISVVGMGGLGKTTLVKRVYDDVSSGSEFNHYVWINVSESFKLEELFKDVIRQLFGDEGQRLPQDVEVMDINRLKRVVQDFLQTKKYLVVFDDVWKLTHWDAIHLVFPRNQCGSRVVITTRNLEVGEAASMREVGGSVYSLRPLPYKEAKSLFCRKAFSSAVSCPKHLEQICEQVLSACQGLPLAIEVIGSVLATKSQRKEVWELFYKSLGAELGRNSKFDSVMKLLSLSYYDLPSHLKTCFLYLSIFPEDAKIWNDHLVQLWIAEGFVERIDGMTLEEVANSYLHELVDRCLVQVATTDHQGSILTIQVHDIIRHIILLKANEQKLTTIVRGEESMSFKKNVRRLSLHGSICGDFEESQSYCKSIRTLVLHKYAGGNISESFLSHLLSHGRKLVKVLDLDGAELERIPDEVFKLFHLKYLNLTNTNVRVVPESVGKLQSLQTLNLSGTHLKELPVDIQRLQHLRNLIIGSHYQQPFFETFEFVQGVRASYKIGKLKSLQQLRHIEVDEVDSIRLVKEMGQLVQLRALGITKLKREDGKELCSSLGNLTQLRELYVYSANEDEVIDLQYLNSGDLPRLQILDLTGRLEICPEWISYLHELTRIDLHFSKLSDDPLECIQDLPNLINLYLTSAYEGEHLCFKAGGFPRLEDLHLKFLQELKCLTVEENALPRLKHMWWRVCESMEEIPTGTENLVHLRDLEFSNMSNEFVKRLDDLSNESVAFKTLVQIPRVVISNFADGRWLEHRYWNK